MSRKLWSSENGKITMILLKKKDFPMPVGVTVYT